MTPRETLLDLNAMVHALEGIIAHNEQIADLAIDNAHDARNVLAKVRRHRSQILTQLDAHACSGTIGVDYSDPAHPQALLDGQPIGPIPPTPLPHGDGWWQLPPTDH